MYTSAEYTYDPKHRDRLKTFVETTPWYRLIFTEVAKPHVYSAETMDELKNIIIRDTNDIIKSIVKREFCSSVDIEFKPLDKNVGFESGGYNFYLSMFDLSEEPEYRADRLRTFYNVYCEYTTALRCKLDTNIANTPYGELRQLMKVFDMTLIRTSGDVYEDIHERIEKLTAETGFEL